MKLQPIFFAEAREWVHRHHRHHRPPVSHLFSLAANNGQQIVGVVIVGRPVAAALQDGLTVEITRCCTDGTPNACSFLYAAAWRAAKALGYARLITYTLPEEGGASLRAVGWKPTEGAGGGSWSRPGCGRHRIDLHPTQVKIRWEVS